MKVSIKLIGKFCQLAPVFNHLPNPALNAPLATKT